MEFTIIIFNIVVYATFIKSLIVGSSFSFYYWIKYGEIYTNWYLNQPTFKEYIKEKR